MRLTELHARQIRTRRAVQYVCIVNLSPHDGSPLLSKPAATNLYSTVPPWSLIWTANWTVLRTRCKPTRSQLWPCKLTQRRRLAKLAMGRSGSFFIPPLSRGTQAYPLYPSCRQQTCLGSGNIPGAWRTLICSYTRCFFSYLCTLQ